jgi:hypothetical protein
MRCRLEKNASVITLAALVLFVSFTGLQMSVIYAQTGFTEQDAIDSATVHPVFADGLKNHKGWTAAAYDTENAYGIWRVQFWDSEGEELAWADVNPARGKVYIYEAHFNASDVQFAAATKVLREYINSAPEVLELVENPTDYEIYPEYDAWNRWWGVYLDIGSDSLYFVVEFEDKTPGALDNPKMVAVYFPNILSYTDWDNGMKAKAVAEAFTNQEIADLLDGKSWTTKGEQAGEGLWRVTFWEGETLLMTVTVDVEADTVVEYSIEE